MDELLHWNELPTQVDAILAEVWTNLDIDKQLQQAQEKIDHINNGHSEIGEIFDGVEHGIIDLESELHPTNSNGEPMSFYECISDSLTKLKDDVHDLHLKIQDIETNQENSNDGLNSEEDFVFVYSDESSCPLPSPKCLSDKETAQGDTPCTESGNVELISANVERVGHEASNRQLRGTDSKKADKIGLSEQTGPDDSCRLIPCNPEDPTPNVELPLAFHQPACQATESMKQSTQPSTVSHNSSMKKATMQPPTESTVASCSEKPVKMEITRAHTGEQVHKGGQPLPYIEPDVIDLCNDDQDDVIQSSQPHPTKPQHRYFKSSQGSRVLAMKRSNRWFEAVIMSVIKDNNSKEKYKLKFDDDSMALVSGRHVATVFCPKPSNLHVGSRVVAEYMKETKATLLAGMIAEVPMFCNKARHLIFFDNGCAQYTFLNKIHLVCEASNNAWEDVPEDSKEFIKEYLDKYPERPMVRLNCGQSIKTEWRGAWWRAKVVEVDASLVKMNFPSDNRNEWIYKGSPRLEPLHRELETAKYLRESGRLIANSSVSKKRGGPRVEYLRIQQDFLVPENDILAVAEGKKSVATLISSKTPQCKTGVTSRAVDDMPVVQWAIKTLRDWCESHNLPPKFEELSDEMLASLLERVYRDGPKEKPGIFTYETLQALRCALSTFLTEPPISRKVDIYSDVQYGHANKAFIASTEGHYLNQEALEKAAMPLLGLSRRDMVKLLKSGLVSLNNPLGLLRLVWIFIQPFIGRVKGKVKSPNLELLQKSDVIDMLAKSGLPYYQIRSLAMEMSDSQAQQIYATGNRFYCPYHAISSYISKLNPSCSCFFQQPRTNIIFRQETIWFEAEPMSLSTINKLMPDIASAAKLTRLYSNADMGATPWVHLQEAIEDFSVHLRIKYRNTVALSATMSTTSDTKSAVKMTKSKPTIQQSSAMRPSHQHSSTNPLTRQLLHDTHVTKGKQESPETDDDDVIIIETSNVSPQVNKIHNTEPRSEKQQMARKSTSSHTPPYHHQHHGKMHRHSRHRRVSPHKENVSFKSKEGTNKRKIYVPHQCCRQCVEESIKDKKRKDKIKPQNPLRLPSSYGWTRRLAKRSGNGKRHVVYQAPCGRSLRNIEEVDRYLTETKMTDVCVDAFTFNPFVYTRPSHYRAVQRPYLKISDISKGCEPVPVSLVNEIDNEQPPDVKYISTRQPEKGSEIIIDAGFLICCDCTDNCKDNSKCACRQLTRKSAEDFPEINKNLSEIGYKYRRLKSMVSTGIYECNERCSCSKQCHNRVAQNGLSLRLQIFKTDKRGWGLRCLDDIPEGAFVCTYAGQLWGAEEANKRGQAYGDEYFAELDHIEVVENSKEGYESDSMEDEGISDSKASNLSSSSISDQCLSSDDDYHVSSHGSDTSSIAIDVENQSDDSNHISKGQNGDSLSTKMVFRRQASEPGSGSMLESNCWSVAFPYKDSTQSKVEAWVNSNPVQTSNEVLNGMSDTTASGMSSETMVNKITRKGLATANAESADKCSKNSIDSYKAMARKSSGAKREQVALKKSVKRDCTYKDQNEESSRESSTSIFKYGYNTSPGKVLDSSLIEAFRKSSHTRKLHLRKKTKDPGDESKSASLASGGDTSESEYSSSTGKAKGESASTDKMQYGIQMVTSAPITGAKECENKTPIIRTRSFFGESSGHVMDAKFIGNLGRYLNHSCRPNLFVQNVFVDSHDLRFPWVAFFSRELVRAGSELTWDYNYDVGSVPGKSLICLCGSRECRGRLL